MANYAYDLFRSDNDYGLPEWVALVQKPEDAVALMKAMGLHLGWRVTVKEWDGMKRQYSPAGALLQRGDEWFKYGVAKYEVGDIVLVRLADLLLKCKITDVYIGGYRVSEVKSGWGIPVDENDIVMRMEGTNGDSGTVSDDS